MITQSFYIDGQLPSMNDIVRTAKGHHMKYVLMKSKYTNMVAMLVREAKLKPVGRVAVSFTWCESIDSYKRGHRRDPDNICAGAKFVLDGLVAASVLKNDDMEVIGAVEHRFMMVAGRSGVKVVLSSDTVAREPMKREQDSLRRGAGGGVAARRRRNTEVVCAQKTPS